MVSMLSKPKYGWSTLKIGNFTSRISYLTDVPFDSLNASLASLKYGTSLSIGFDAEGWEFDIMSNKLCTFIIMNNEEGEDVLIKESVSKEELIKEIVDDIELNVSEWAFWDLDEYVVEKNKENILNLIKEIRTLL